MKIEIRYLTTESPFRRGCWAVLKDGVVQAYCFTSEAAAHLELMLRLHEKGGES